LRGLVLISGGIDSPVAAYLMGKQGMGLVYVHYDNRPFTSDEEIDKAVSLMNKVDEALGTTSKRLLVPHGRSQTEFARCCRRNMQCVLCRRMMFRVAEKLAETHGADCIVTGESLGQVASQTLTNLNVEEMATRLPILRPLIGLDKIEIERIAKDIGTYDTSIMPGLCCTIAPKKPSTYSRLGTALEEEGKVDLERLADEEASGTRELT
jgi:thiamine biosynthesis protein ThiI